MLGSEKEVVIALFLAGLINLSIMIIAAAVFYQTGNSQVANIKSAFQTLTPLLGSAAASAFLILNYSPLAFQAPQVDNVR